MTYDNNIVDIERIQFVKSEDLELEPDDIIRTINLTERCEHPEWRRCLELDSDTVIYECVECSLVKDKMPKPKPLSQQDPAWL